MKDLSRPTNGKSAFGEALSPKGNLELDHKCSIVTPGVKSLTFGPGWYATGEQEARVRTLVEAGFVAQMFCLGCFTFGEN